MRDHPRAMRGDAARWWPRWGAVVVLMAAGASCAQPTGAQHPTWDGGSTSDLPRGELGAAGGDVADVPDEDQGASPEGRCVWNLAYQENTKPDSLSAALDPQHGARGCYVLVDPFDDDAVADAIPALRAAGNLVGCYVSVGTCEDWRADFADLAPACTSKEWSQWPGEVFVRDVEAARPWMEARLERLAAWGCDLVELDNMDWAQDPDAAQTYGLAVTPVEAVAYYQGLCAFARARGVGCVAKSTAEGAKDFDGMTVESSPEGLDWWDHGALRAFADAGKLAVIFHYGETDCAQAEAFYRTRYGSGLSWLCEDLSAGGYAHD